MLNFCIVINGAENTFLGTEDIFSGKLCHATLFKRSRAERIHILNLVFIISDKLQMMCNLIIYFGKDC